MKINVKIPKKINIGEIKVSNPDYVLPIASKDILGGIKVGKNLTIDEDGTLNATGELTGEYEESDPTVPQHVKNITQKDIDNWNNGTGDVDLTDYAKKSELPTKTSQLENDSNFINKIKTINGQSLEGEGNIEIESGSGGTTELSEFVVIGDSWSDLSVERNVWSTMVASSLGLNLHNYAIKGAGFVSPETNLMSTQVQTFLNSNVDKAKVKYIVLLGGVNDYLNDITYDVLAPTIVETIRTLKTNCPNANVFYVNNWQYPNTGRQDRYWDNIYKTILNEISVPIYNTCGKYDNTLFISDYYHLTLEGQKYLAQNILSTLMGCETYSCLDQRSIIDEGNIGFNIRSEKVSSNMAVMNVKIVPQKNANSYTISVPSGEPDIPYYDLLDQKGLVIEGNIHIFITVKQRTITVTSSANLTAWKVHPVDLFIPLH